MPVYKRVLTSLSAFPAHTLSFVQHLTLAAYFFIILNIFVRRPEVQAPPIPALCFCTIFLVFIFFPDPYYQDWLACVSECQIQSGLFRLPSFGYPESRTFTPYFASVDPEDLQRFVYPSLLCCEAYCMCGAVAGANSQL